MRSPAKQGACATGFLAALTWLLIAGSAGAQEAGPGAQCSALAATDLSRLQDAPTQILSAQLRDGSEDAASVCQVSGYVAPAVGFELLLPTEGWNGKLLQVGCGGYCGQAFVWQCTEPLRKGYACVASDMGHRSTPFDGKWAYNNLPAKIDFGYRATHVTAIASKALVDAYYGSDAERSYFMGCSTGGRQGLVAAQRFPEDFDGIVAGAPIINLTGAVTQLLWSSLSNLDAEGNRILTPEDLRAVHEAVLARCDADDGLADGVVGDPLQCRFDPDALACEDDSEGFCLDARQRTALRAIYDGPSASDEGPVYTGGAAVGSELRWIGSYVSESAEQPPFLLTVVDDVFRYLGFMPSPGPDWQPQDFDFDRDPARLALGEALYSGSNPDLRRFKQTGGKLLIYQGWNDDQVVPANIIDYYETMTRTMGGAEEARDFARLFLVPGMAHCFGGNGADAIDYLDYLDRWVETGEAPDRMIAHKTVEPISFGQSYAFPLAEDAVEFTRPVFAYPATPRYDGEGDPDSAESFVPDTP